MSETTDYVIYCRKSTDESSGKQVQSIPDQIRTCVRYAQANGLKIKEKPADFSDFESSADLAKEDAETELPIRALHQETRNLFIIKEQQSAKTPGLRPKRTRLIQRIKKGKIKGLLSYSPDRQARNLEESGVLITLVDDGRLDLKYTNFHFESNASGKMMLGIRFVFSKQYSDKLSEDITRGSHSKLAMGKALGINKHGYLINRAGFHEPHPLYFKLLQEAFRLKIEENKTDAYLTARLQRKGYQAQKYDNEGILVKEYDFSGKNMYNIRTDPFYYGILTRGDQRVDLREVSEHYEPLIAEEQHKRLIEKYYENRLVQTVNAVKAEHEDLMPLPPGLVVAPDKAVFLFTLPNKKRFYKRLDLLRLKKPTAVLSDVVEKHQIRYRCLNKKDSVYRNAEVKYDKIEKSIVQTLNTLKPDHKMFEQVQAYLQTQFQESEAKRAENLRKLQVTYNQTQWKLKTYVLENMSRARSETEKKIYDGEVKRLELILQSIETEMKVFREQVRDGLLEFQAFVSVLSQAGTLFEKVPNVQKQKIVSLFVLNVVAEGDWQVQTYVKPWLEGFFSRRVLSAGEVLNAFREEKFAQSPSRARTLIQLYLKDLKLDTLGRSETLAAPERAFYEL